jgi:hypothetical protein
MSKFRFHACLIAVLTICIHGAAGQTNRMFAQDGGAVAAIGRPQISNARSSAPIVPNAHRGAVRASARAAASRPIQAVAQRPANLRSNSSPSVTLRPNYSTSVRRLNPRLAAMNARQRARTYNVEPNVELLAKNDVALDTLPPTNTQRTPRRHNLQPRSTVPAREDLEPDGLATADVRTDGKIRRPRSDEPQSHETPQGEPRHQWHGGQHHRSYSDALRRHRHQWHHRDWWDRNCETIVFVNSGYYFLDAGYWYPAWGYDPLYSSYDYDGPIYTYGNLLPDQVIANVQGALQDAGYYFGAITGSLNVETRAALANFQRDYGLPITGAIDQPTVETLGLY